jgi:hypothetical protein
VRTAYSAHTPGFPASSETTFCFPSTHSALSRGGGLSNCSTFLWIFCIFSSGKTKSASLSNTPYGILTGNDKLPWMWNGGTEGNNDIRTESSYPMFIHSSQFLSSQYTRALSLSLHGQSPYKLHAHESVRFPHWSSGPPTPYETHSGGTAVEGQNKVIYSSVILQWPQGFGCTGNFLNFHSRTVTSLRACQQIS